MGTWGFEPWESDLAADWYAKMFEKTKLDGFVEKTLSLDSSEYCEEIRAAASVLIRLCQKGIWPAEKLGHHLELAIIKLQGILSDKNCPLNESQEIIGGKTQREIAEQLRINDLGGIENLANQRNPIGPNRSYLLEGLK
jgi:hypothetical protein